MLRALKRLLAFFGFGRRSSPPGADRDPYAWRPVPRTRKPTRPTKGSQRRRVDSKVKRGQTKATRRKVVE